jgi:ketosteroid isomerase-like protein
MRDIESMIDRFEIEALRVEFTDAAMMHDYDRRASLYTEDGVYRIPFGNIEITGREAIRAWGERAQGEWDYFVQTMHPGTIQLEGDTAVGRVYISEIGRLRDGSSHLNYGVFHDRYRRTEGGWKFAERVYEIRYLDTTPLAGSAPQAAQLEAQAPHDSTSSPKGRP